LAVEVSSLGLNCHDCNEAKKKYRGCKGNPVQPFMWEGKPLDRCPIKKIPAEVSEYIRYYSYYKKGILPFRGGLSEQPAKLLDIFDVIESKEIEVQKRNMETR
jgi:hypothetical protein